MHTEKHNKKQGPKEDGAGFMYNPPHHTEGGNPYKRGTTQ
jgi:hypothetical protein